jgi:long-subunit fatty acid transport protein
MAENNEISNLLDVTNEFRLGAEYKIRQVSLRGGYRFEQSPYKNGTTVSDLTGYSGGIGYNFGTTKLDLAYSFAQRDYNTRMFSQGLTDSARINSKNSNISLTLVFEL